MTFSANDIVSFKQISEKNLACQTLLCHGEEYNPFNEIFGGRVSKPAIAHDVTCLIPFGGEHGHSFVCLQSLATQSVLPAEILIGLDYTGPRPEVPESLREIVRFVEIPNPRIGPFKTMEFLIRHAQTDLLMLQDSDDLSFPRRLEIQRDLLINRQLDGVGAAVVHFQNDYNATHVGIFPAAPRDALYKKFGHALLYPTLLMTQDGFRRSGGFAHVESFGLDTEFVNRFAFKNRVANISEPTYLKRMHETSLTQRAATGFGSTRRKTVERHAKRSWRDLYTRSFWQRMFG